MAGTVDGDDLRTRHSRLHLVQVHRRQHAIHRERKVDRCGQATSIQTGFLESFMSQGKVVQIIGAVVDVEFPRDQVPKVYDALKVEGTAITLEVQQQLGDGVVRTIALGSTGGIKRNL